MGHSKYIGPVPAVLNGYVGPLVNVGTCGKAALGGSVTLAAECGAILSPYLWSHHWLDVISANPYNFLLLRPCSTGTGLA